MSSFAKLGLKDTLLGFKEKYSVCQHVYSALIDLYEEENTSQSLKEAENCCDLLIKNFDTIHYKFWEYKKSQIAQKIQKLENK